jgi:hypothetical protein
MNVKKVLANVGMVAAIALPTLATIPSATVAHGDDYDCDASYMPCDGSNADYLTGEVPPPSDPIYQTSLDDETDGTAAQRAMAEQIAQGINPDTGQPYGA